MYIYMYIYMHRAPPPPQAPPVVSAVADSSDDGGSFWSTFGGLGVSQQTPFERLLQSPDCSVEASEQT